MRKIPCYTIILGVVFCLMLAGCGSGSGGGSTTEANLETEAQSLTSLGEFPVGIADYTPSTIKILNTNGESLATTEVVSVTDLEQVSTGTWKLVITGTFTAPEMGGEKLEIAGVYVNWDPIADNGTDELHLPTSDTDGSFIKTLYVTAKDLSAIYFPITVAVVDEMHYVAGERAVVVLQKTAAVSTISDAVKVLGNKDFVLNTMNMALAAIDGQNLAPYIPGTQWTIPETVQNDTDPHITLLDISPRNVMLQGIQVTGYTVESDGAEGYYIYTDITVRNLVVEYNYSNLINHTKGKNYINMRTKNLGINGGFVLHLEKDTENDGYKASLTIDEDVTFAAGSTGDLDTPLFSVLGSVIDFILAFLQATLNITVENPIHINLAQPVMTALIKQIANDQLLMTGTAPIQTLTLDDTGISLSAYSTAKSLKTYATPYNHATEPTMDLSGTNSTIALKDDYINQVLADYLAGVTIADTTIDDLGAYIEDLIDSFGYEDLELGIWNWLMDEDGAYPPLNINFVINTPPIFIPDATGATLGTLYLRDTRLEIWQVDDEENPVQLLATISIDMDMRMQWEGGKITLNLINNTAQYALLFNKLYPLFLPSEIKQIPTVVANTLNEILTKLGIVGYTVQDMISTGGYLAIHGDLGTYTDSSAAEAVVYNQADWTTTAYLATLVTGTDTESTTYKPTVMDITSSLLEDSDKAVADTGGIAFTADDTQLTWDDSMVFIYTAPENHYITHVSFTPEIVFSGFIATSLDYYEEFALISVLHETQLDETYQHVSGNASDPSIAPKPEFAIARDVEFNDSDLTTTIQTYEGSATGTINQDLPFCKTVGIALRFRKSPAAIVQEIILDAIASNIVVTTVDLSLSFSQ